VYTPAPVARILLISDDRTMGESYQGALRAGGYHVTLAETFVEVLGTTMPDPDVVVLCGLAVYAYPGQTALVVRIPDKLNPDEVVTQVHRRITLQATLLTTVAQAA
jgi:DNA-binding NtrC family response regulator